MGKIICITNMEPHAIGMKMAAAAIDRELPFTVNIFQTDSEEVWRAHWQTLLEKADFVLVTWMGTGFDCDFLKQSSAYMQKKKIRHLYQIVDPGTDKMDCGITPGERECIRSYLGSGGIRNYKNMYLWMAHAFSGLSCDFEPPCSMPWCGIYDPGEAVPAFDVKEYIRRYCNPALPTIGFIFPREDWLWGKMDWETELICEIRRAGYNAVGVFTNTMGNPDDGVPGLAENLRACFCADGRVYIDVLINPFVFSLTVTGFLKLDDLRQMGVPILQVYHTYMNRVWWDRSKAGLTPNEISYAIAMPEFDGIIHAVPVSTREERDDGAHFHQFIPERLSMLVRKAGKWAVLRRKPNSKKKVAIVFHNYPPTNSNIGSASCLDSIESVRQLIADMKQLGYRVDRIPETSQEFIDEVTVHATNDRRFLSDELLDHADGKMSSVEYRKFFDTLPEETKDQLVRDWGEPPGEVFRHGDDVIVPGMLNGNLYITVQPPRGFGDDPGKIYHSPDCAPTHQYLAVYAWIRDVWKADAMIHVGTHGNLEWLPGKGVAMSNGCYPDIATGDMPNIYPYWITCVGEGIQAKRRSAACLISYLSAPMSLSGTYEELADLEHLLEEYCHFKGDEEAQGNLESIRGMIRSKAAECNLDEDVPEDKTADFNDYVAQLHVFVTDIKNMQITTGLHILGIPPKGDEMTEYLLALTKMDNGKIPSLTKSMARAYGHEYYELLEHSAAMLPDGSRTYGMLLDDVQDRCREIIRFLAEQDFDPAAADRVALLPWAQECIEQGQRDEIREVSRYICTNAAPGLLQTVLEKENLLRALDGFYIDPSASGAPTSGGADLLPTGRNFYSIDPRALPTSAAWEIGKEMGDNVIARFIEEEGRYPESVGIILWATSNLRNHGQCVAEFLYLMGMRPVWQSGSRRVVGIEVIPLSELKRPRIDITGRISGLFRDGLPASVIWMDKAVDIVAKLDEPLDMNFVRRHVLQEAGELEEEGMSREEAWRQASFRIFGDPPGAHGAGTGAVLEAKNWETIDDIAAVYTRWGGHAYGEGSEGTYLPERFTQRMSQIDVTIQNIDHRESSMLSGDDYNNYRGGMIAAVRSAKGSMPRNYVNDSSDRSKIQIRSLTEELKRWFRGEAMNPKYIQGMQKHGYKGAGDLATYVATSYQWDATSDIMEDWMYEKYAQKYAMDPKMQEWMKEVNPWALQRIAEVLLEASQRGLWNAKEETKKELEKLYLSIEGELEERGDVSGSKND